MLKGVIFDYPMFDGDSSPKDDCKQLGYPRIFENCILYFEKVCIFWKACLIVASGVFY